MVVITAVEVWNAVAMVALSAIAYQLFTKVLWDELWEPLRLRRIMAKQGVKGGSRCHSNSLSKKLMREVVSLLEGNSHTRLVVRDPEIAKEVFVSSFTSLKWSASSVWFVKMIVGQGITVFVGEKWATERRTINPFFHQDVLKGMVEAVVEGTATGIHKWEQIAAEAGGSAEIDVEPDVHKISGRVLSLTAFGGDFETGQQVYDLQMEMIKELNQMVRDVKFWLIPFYRTIPTKQHRRIDQMGAEIDTLVRGVMNARLEAVRNGEAGSYGNDLLGLMLMAATEGWEEDTREFNLASVLNNGGDDDIERDNANHRPSTNLGQSGKQAYKAERLVHSQGCDDCVHSRSSAPSEGVLGRRH